MKYSLALFAALCCCFFSTPAKSQLLPGDILFTGYNSVDNTVNGPTSNDDFCFIALRTIPVGTKIMFTDFGWASDVGRFQSIDPCGTSSGAYSDGAIEWTATAEVKYGTQVRIRCRVNLQATTGTVLGVINGVSVPTDYISFVTGGDQIFAFQGPITAPTSIIAGLGMNGPWDATLSNCEFNASKSAVPPAIASFAFAIVPEVNNARLKAGINITGNVATDRATINNLANWEFDDVNALAIPSTLTLLPANFLSFSGEPGNGNVKLQWKVGAEQNVKDYRVERSTNGSEWQEIGTVPATGSSVYTWSGAAVSGRFNYRIVAVDLDTRVRYSQVITLDPSQKKWQLKVTPNPATDFADISVTSVGQERITLQLIDMYGKVCWQQQSVVNTGVQVIRLQELSGMAKGVYVLQLQSSETGYKQQVKLVKQ